MSHLHYMPGDPRLVDQLVYELKSKGIFDQFRKECIADVDTRPAYQNLRQRVESSVATFLSRQIWQPDLNKNQLREKLRKHLLEGNYLEQGVERIVDQVVNPKVASVFIPQVEDLVYNYLGIPRKKTAGPETSNGRQEDLLPTDLEAVSPGSVKSNDERLDMDTSDSKEEKMEVDDNPKVEIKEDSISIDLDKDKEETRLSGISELTIHDSDVSIDKNTITIPLPTEEIKLENIPAPENSPPKINDKKIDLEKIDLPKEPNLSTDIPLPDEIPKVEGDAFFQPIANSDDDDTSSDSSLRRNMSPLTPIRNFNNENSCDAQQAFENDSDSKNEDKKEPSTFRFTIESKSNENSSDETKIEKKEEPVTYQYNTPTNINTFNTPMYDDSSNSNNLQIDYESDANSKAVDIKVPETEQNSQDVKKEKKDEKRSSSHKSSHRSRDSHPHSSSKDKRSDSKHSTSRDSSRHNKKSSSKDDKSKSSNKEKEKSSDKTDKKDSRDSSKHRTSSHKSSRDKEKDSKHKSSSSSKHSSKDDRKSSSSSSRDKEKSSSEKPKESKDRSKDSKSSSSRDKDRKSSSSKRSDGKENKEKKEKKEADDHYSLSGRGNPNRRSTDRDSNDGSSSSKGSHNRSHSKSTGSKKENKSSTKSDNTNSSGDSTSPRDSIEVNQAKKLTQGKPLGKPIIRVDTHLETPVSTPPRLPFVPDVTLKKPKFAANMHEAKQMIKMRKFLEEEQKRMNQEAALLLEFQANVRPSLSQVYSSIPGPELEFACVSNSAQPHSQVIVFEEPNHCTVKDNVTDSNPVEVDNNNEVDKKLQPKVEFGDKHDEIAKTLIAMHDDGNNINPANEQSKVHIEDQEHTNDSILDDLTDEKEIELKNEEIMEESKLTTPETIPKQEEILTNVDAVERIENKNEIIIEVQIPIKIEELPGTMDTPSTSNKILNTEESIQNDTATKSTKKTKTATPDSKENSFQYFGEHEKFNAELEVDKFTKFFKRYTENLTSKMYVINCDMSEQNLIREAAATYGQFEIINYYKNGHLKLQATKSIVKDINVANEITLPTKIVYERPASPDIMANTNDTVLFSPKSECSFELSSDYDAKLEEMVNKTSRKEIMEIILGGVIDESPSKMPRIDYCMESNIEENNLKRKISEVESTNNNNRQVLTPNKMRKLSGSDQITSTTEEAEEIPNRVQNKTLLRSKFLGKARRVGLPKPKKSNIQNSPSSDKSVENYEHNDTPNGKIKTTPRAKVQRYDTSDLYKPKLHYLSRRNHIT